MEHTQHTVPGRLPCHTDLRARLLVHTIPVSILLSNGPAAMFSNPHTHIISEHPLVSSLHHYACMRVYLYRGFYQLM